jgi:hypothetical protein
MPLKIAMNCENKLLDGWIEECEWLSNLTLPVLAQDSVSKRTTPHSAENFDATMFISAFSTKNENHCQNFARSSKTFVPETSPNTVKLLSMGSDGDSFVRIILIAVRIPDLSRSLDLYEEELQHSQ